MRRILRFFTLGPLVAKIVIAATFLMQFFFGSPQGSYVQNFKSIGPVVSEEKIFEKSSKREEEKRIKIKIKTKKRII